jgi:hypothetical protein
MRRSEQQVYGQGSSLAASPHLAMSRCVQMAAVAVVDSLDHTRPRHCYNFLSRVGTVFPLGIVNRIDSAAKRADDRRSG